MDVLFQNHIKHDDVDNLPITNRGEVDMDKIKDY